MPQLKYSYLPAPGLQDVVSPQNSILEYISLRVLQLNPGERYVGNSGDEELALVLITGTSRIKTAGCNWENVGGRRSPFEKPAHTVYLPCNTDYEITALHSWWK